MQIGEVASFQNGYAFKSKDFVQDGKYKIIKIKELKNGKVRFFNDSASVNVDDERIIEKYIVEKGDVLFALTGDPVNKNNPLSWVGRVSVYEDDQLVLLNQRVCKLIPKKRLNAKYIYYYFRVFNNFYALASIAKGSASQANISTKDIEAMEITLPSLNIQNKIVSVLDSIEEKINQNNKINKNLEQQAQAIYQQMFIGNASSDWAKGTLSDIADITMGQSPSSSSYNEDGNGTIFFQGRAEFGFRFPTVRLYTTEPKRIACANDTLMSVRAPVGDLNVAHTNCCIGRGLAAIHSKNNRQSFVLYTMLSLKKQLDVFNGEGTVFGSINRISLNEMPLLIPSSEKIDEFEALVAPMDAAVRNNYDEICRLEQLRDTLLPKLMSGELDVSDIDF
jgi:type I restriction enzyme S subunit